ncbi:uncharacterized protein V1510DRAFT_410990 [Dipodascopsis tothii]|uniref:uncharacterized protein n=1 Tax=Dipodascopsis tothii TaxID=44089 RepID=UPI0034CF4DA6
MHNLQRTRCGHNPACPPAGAPQLLHQPRQHRQPLHVPPRDQVLYRHQAVLVLHLRVALQVPAQARVQAQPAVPFLERSQQAHHAVAHLHKLHRPVLARQREHEDPEQHSTCAVHEHRRDRLRARRAVGRLQIRDQQPHDQLDLAERVCARIRVQPLEQLVVDVDDGGPPQQHPLCNERQIEVVADHQPAQRVQRQLLKRDPVQEPLRGFLARAVPPHPRLPVRDRRGRGRHGQHGQAHHERDIFEDTRHGPADYRWCRLSLGCVVKA